MCRLFGMSGGREPVRASFWLLDAPDSLSAESHHNPDGTGLGSFAADGHPVISKQPIAAYEDASFGQDAREATSRTFVAHVRFATGGGKTVVNTHPFEMDGRLFAHNGVIGDLPALEQELGDALGLVQGDTDSERFFALITREIAAAGDVSEGIGSACRWVAENLPVLSINFVLISTDELWTLRYPDTHTLHLLERDANGGELAHHGAQGNIRVSAADLGDRPAVIVASEEMDDDDGWVMLAPGELVHVNPSLEVHRERIITGPPAHPLTLAELEPQAAASQRAAAQA